MPSFTAYIRELEAAGYKVLQPHEAEGLETSGKMLALYGPDCFPPPNEQGQRHFGDIMMETAATEILSIFYPIRELCAHAIDDQAGVCRRCGCYEEHLPAVRAAQGGA